MIPRILSWLRPLFNARPNGYTRPHLGSALARSRPGSAFSVRTTYNPGGERANEATKRMEPSRLRPADR